MKKNLTHYLNFDYTVRLKENSDGTYFAEIEELTGCMTEGDTKEEALAMIEDAKKVWLETALERGMRIPEPSSDDFSGKLNIRLPKYVHRRLSYKAREEGVSLNSLINAQLSDAIK